MNAHITRLIFAFAIVLIVLGSDAFPQRRRPAPPPRVSGYLPPDTTKSSPEQKRRLETFDKAWRTIFYYYFDSKFNNVDWQAAKIEFEPKVRAATTDDQVHDLINSMIARLKVSHLGIIKPAVYEEIAVAKATARSRALEREQKFAAGIDPSESELDDFDLDDPLALYGPGIELRFIDQRFVISRVRTDSAAAYRGLKPGFILESVDDVSLNELVSRVLLLEGGKSKVYRELPMLVVKELLNGEKDSKVKLGYIDGDDKKGESVIRRELLKTTTVSMGVDYPETQLTFEAQELDSETGYIHFDNFSLPVIAKFCDALTTFKDKKSLIIDLRGNDGGIIGIAIALSGMLTETSINVGTSIYRHQTEEWIATSKAKNYKGRIVVLTDEYSASSAEVFAAALQGAGRAKVVGGLTAGQALPAAVVDLPTGARLFYPIANLKTSQGKLLEGFGVTPDTSIALSRASLLKGIDDQLNAARLATRTPIATAPPAVPVVRSESGVNPPLPAPPAKAPPAKVPTRSFGKNLATVTVKAPPPPPPIPDTIDKASLDLIKEFDRLTGGVSVYEGIRTFEMEGSVEMVHMGARSSHAYKRYRDANKRDLVIYSSDATGEVRQFRDQKIFRVSSELGITKEIPLPEGYEESDIISSIARSLKISDYKKLNYLGEFDRGARKVHLIDGKTKDDVTVAIYFDTETKMLAGFEGPSGGLSFSDYRKIGDVWFPFDISSQEFLKIKLTDVKINNTLDPSVFEPKLHCYDLPISK